MPTPRHKAIARMEWDTLEERLQTTTRGGKRNAAEEQTLREYFGEDYENLQRLANHARLVRSRAPLLGNVVLLPGIMGSNLSTVESDGDADLVWINLFRLAAGRLAQLQLADDGEHEAVSGITVQATALDKRTYARAILWLRARWNVQPFAYDWRRDLDESADVLAQFIRERFGDRPVHLVAHSMGGLVSRNFIRRHKDQWEKMRDGEGASGGRLIMLGTPNFGSFAIPQALTGVEKMVRLLAAIDLRHDTTDLLDILNSFVGSYQMLPAPSQLPVPLQALYRRETWGSFPISETHLRRAFQFHQDLDTDGAVDPERMRYIAGCNQETLASLTITAPGEFDYTTTLEGDGRVPFTLGLLKNVPAYYVEEGHGDLPKNDKVLTAVDELLERGRTTALPDRPPLARALTTGHMRWHRSVHEQQVGAELEQIAERAQKNQASAEEIRIAEETVMRAIMGESPRVRTLRHAKAAREQRARPQAERIPLHIELVHGGITQVQAPVIVVGHYKGIAPSSAEGAIDEKVGGWITRAVDLGIIGGDLGRLFFIPLLANQLKARAAVLAGMGEAGHFTRDDLRFLMTNVTFGASALGLDRFATVLIGSGEGNLPKERALRATLEGLCDALHRLAPDKRVVRLTLVESSAEVYRDLDELLKHFKKEETIPLLTLELSRKTIAQPKSSRQKGATQADSRGTPQSSTRITIERQKDVFRFSALSDTAVIPVRDVEVQSFFATETAERLMNAETLEEQEKYGQLLKTYLFPEDFHQLLEEDNPVTLILDRSSAAFPWEMACFRSARGRSFFGPDLQLTRQFRTLLSAAPGVAPLLNQSLKVLVIADPAQDPEFQLPGARREGRAVVQILEQARKQNHALRIDVESCIGPSECDPVDILARLLNEEFDIVHFAGHGIFDEKNPNRSGWVFDRDCILSPLEIFRARRVPRLVVANACFSAVVRQGKALNAEETNRHLAGLAEAFFERGVPNYIGSGWPVGDEQAVTFSSVFYAIALKGKSLGEALADARKAILDEGPTWGAYQHYGQAEAKIVLPS